MKVIDKIKPLLCESRLFQEPGSSQAARAQLKKRKGGLKIGQGGTLDPLADGVLVIGVGRGTKRLQDYLMGPKVSGRYCLEKTYADTARRST